MSLTPKQAAAAHAIGSVTVTAGAGTGKTHMLAERYLYHLRVHNFSPLKIVAVTFTDKAATELRSRIRSLVTKQMSDRTDLLAELEAAQISTIHALATRICREHPEQADVSSDFTVLDELEGILWLDERIDEALDKLPAYLYEQVPYSLMSSAIKTLLKDPIATERALNRGTEDWSHLATQLRQKALEQLLSTWQDALSILHTYIGQAGDLREVARQQIIAALTAFEQGEQKPILESLVNIKLQGGSAKNWSDGGFNEVKEAITVIRDLAKDALKQGLVTCELGSADAQLVAILPAIREAFQLVQDYITQAKHRSKVLDFADLEVHALRAMLDPQVKSYYRQR